MMQEVAAVAKARHIDLPENAVDKTMEMVAAFWPQFKNIHATGPGKRQSDRNRYADHLSLPGRPGIGNSHPLARRRY